MEDRASILELPLSHISPIKYGIASSKKLWVFLPLMKIASSKIMNKTSRSPLRWDFAISHLQRSIWLRFVHLRSNLPVTTYYESSGFAHKATNLLLKCFSHIFMLVRIIYSLFSPQTPIIIAEYKNCFTDSDLWSTGLQLYANRGLWDFHRVTSLPSFTHLYVSNHLEIWISLVHLWGR